MPDRPDIRIETLRERWEESPFSGGLVGIASVAAATVVIGLVCAVIALVAALIY